MTDKKEENGNGKDKDKDKNDTVKENEKQFSEKFSHWDWLDSVFAAEARMKEQDPENFAKLNCLESIKLAISEVDKTLHPKFRVGQKVEKAEI